MTWVVSVATTSRQLGHGRCQNVPSASSDVDGEVPGDQQLKEHQALNNGTGQVKVVLCDPEEAERRDNSHHAENRADREYAFHVPAHRAWRYDGVVVGDHHDRESH